MADCVSPILDIVTRLWDCTANRALYIRDLQGNIETLRHLRNELEDISKDLAQYAAFTNHVKGWLERVQPKLEAVDAILQKEDKEIQQKCLGSCSPRHCCTSYKLGKQVSKEIDVVTKLIEKGSSLLPPPTSHNIDVEQDLIKKGSSVVVADEVPRPMIDEMPMEKTVGMDSMFDEVWKCVQDHKVRIIGLYGMGGVGKTTLLKKLNNKFLETSHNFDVVIWAVVSKEVKLDKIQEIILNKFGIPKETWVDKSEEDRAVQILKKLRNKRFVLLLDDLWDRLDLSKVGVSFSNNQNEFKIVFTTRSEEVCGQMEANARFKLNGLSTEDALDLFQQKVGENVLNSHHELPTLAERVAKECAGLPLALVAIGRAMSSRKTPEEWEHAIKELKSYPSRFDEMGKHVFPTLRFSYDSLSDNTLKTCFLYCSMFPEDHDISNKELIELWIGEGFFCDFDNMYEAQERGKFIISRLKLACLLEGSNVEDISYGVEHVKMHDVLRDMAHWIACDSRNEILVKENAGLINSREIGRWKETVRVSLYGGSTQFLIETPADCPRLQTIFVTGSKQLRTLPGTLFQSICTLTILNLSNNNKLRELPVEIGKLVSLHYLNISKTCVSNLPIEVKNLKLLRILLLDGMMTGQVVIPRDVISSLESLEIYSCFEYDLHLECKFDTKLMIEELERLKKITNVGLSFSSVSPDQKFMSSPKLQSCFTRLSIKECEELQSLDIFCSTMRSMEHLETLHIRNCRNLREVKKICSEKPEPNCFCNLQILEIWKCESLENLTWLIYTPRLRFLKVMDCRSLEEIIAWDFDGSSKIEKAVEIFSNLEKVSLRKLPKLKSICRRAMPFPSLRDITVYRCQSLRKLSLNAESAKSTLKAIQGQRDWLDKLEWEDEATKLAFTSKFQPLIVKDD